MYFTDQLFTNTLCLLFNGTKAVQDLKCMGYLSLTSQYIAKAKSGISARDMGWIIFLDVKTTYEMC